MRCLCLRILKKGKCASLWRSLFAAGAIKKSAITLRIFNPLLFACLGGIVISGIILTSHKGSKLIVAWLAYEDLRETEADGEVPEKCSSDPTRWSDRVKEVDTYLFGLAIFLWAWFSLIGLPLAVHLAYLAHKARNDLTIFTSPDEPQA